MLAGNGVGGPMQRLGGVRPTLGLLRARKFRYSYTRPLGRVPSPQVGRGLGHKLKLCWCVVVLTNTGILSLTFWTGANGLRSACEASAKQTMSGGSRVGQ